MLHLVSEELELRPWIEEGFRALRRYMRAVERYRAYCAARGLIP